MYTYLQRNLPRVMTHRTQVEEKKWPVTSTVQPYEGEPRCVERRFRRRLTKTVSCLRCLGQD